MEEFLDDNDDAGAAAADDLELFLLLFVDTWHCDWQKTWPSKNTVLERYSWKDLYSQSSIHPCFFCFCFHFILLSFTLWHFFLFIKLCFLAFKATNLMQWTQISLDKYCKPNSRKHSVCTEGKKFLFYSSERFLVDFSWKNYYVVYFQLECGFVFLISWNFNHFMINSNNWFLQKTSQPMTPVSAELAKVCLFLIFS